MLTTAELSHLQTCLAEKNLPQETFNAVSECLQSLVESPPVPPPPSPGFASCNGDGIRGIFAWSDWCLDDLDNFGMVGQDQWMRRNAKAMRSRLAGASPRGVALPTTGSNHIKLSTTMRFDQAWLDPMALGGQHLFSLGQGPFRLADGSVSPNHIRLDFSPARDPNITGVGFRPLLLFVHYETL